MPHYLGIEIGGTKLQLVLTDEKCKITKRFRFLIDRHAGALSIRENITSVIQEINASDISGIGVGFGGPINKQSGMVFTSYQVHGWSGFPIRTWLEDKSGCKVTIDNDANVAALAEATFGSGKDFDNVFYITIGSGVGSGLVVKRQIYHGAEPGEAELGHVRLDKSGRTIQSACSGWAVDEKIRASAQRYPESLLASLTKDIRSGEAAVLKDALAANDGTAVRIFEDVIDDLAFGISHAVHLFHPDVIVIGGGFSLIGEPLRRGLERQIQNYIMDAFQPGPVIRLAALGEDVVPVGAAALAIHSSNRIL